MSKIGTVKTLTILIIIGIGISTNVLILKSVDNLFYQLLTMGLTAFIGGALVNYVLFKIGHRRDSKE